MRIILEAIYICTHFHEPFTPNACENIFEYLGQKRTNIRYLKESFDNLKPGIKVTKGEVVFQQFISKPMANWKPKSSNVDENCIE